MCMAYDLRDLNIVSCHALWRIVSFSHKNGFSVPWELETGFSVPYKESLPYKERKVDRE